MKKHAFSTLTARRRTRRFGADRKGAGGMMEELPAFMVVVISLIIFIASSYSASISFGNMRNSASLREDASSYLRAFRSYESILERGTYTGEPLTGQFDPAKLDGLDTSALRKDLNPRHPFNVTVQDMMTNVTWSFGANPALSPGSSHVRESTAALIALPDGDRNPALLTVVMW